MKVEHKRGVILLEMASIVVPLMCMRMCVASIAPDSIYVMYLFKCIVKIMHII